jgi:hypothetical protein
VIARIDEADFFPIGGEFKNPVLHVAVTALDMRLFATGNLPLGHLKLQMSTSEVGKYMSVWRESPVVEATGDQANIQFLNI